MISVFICEKSEKIKISIFCHPEVSEAQDPSKESRFRAEIPRNDVILVGYPVSFFVIVYICIFFFVIFRLPIIDDDFLCQGPEIYGFAASQGLIQFCYIITSDILFTTSHKMSLHHI